MTSHKYDIGQPIFASNSEYDSRLELIRYFDLLKAFVYAAVPNLFILIEINI